MTYATLLYAHSGGVTAVINATAAAAIAAAREQTGRVRRILAAHRGIGGVLREDLIDTAAFDAAALERLATQLALEAPPPSSKPPERTRSFKGVKVDHAAREHACRRLGRSGEDMVLAYERQRLREADRPDLAEAVEHVSRTEGDGLGYDILSYTPDEAKKYIEVKTTNFDKTTSFLITDNEVAFSATKPEHYHLYRLFEFGSGPKLYTLRGPIEQTCWLLAKRFEAGVK